MLLQSTIHHWFNSIRLCDAWWNRILHINESMHQLRREKERRQKYDKKSELAKTDRKRLQLNIL